MSYATLNDVYSYIDNVLRLLGDWKWLYSTQTTRVLVENIIQTNSEILSIIRPPFRDIPYGRVESDWPDKLKDFVLETSRLTLQPQEHRRDGMMSLPKIDPGVNVKKQHEIQYLLPILYEYSDQLGLTSFVDIGSGVGYIDRYICDAIPTSTVVAVECDRKKSETAQEENVKKGFGSRIHQLPMRVESESLTDLKGQIDKDNNHLLVALHACGDLSTNCLRLFDEVEAIKCAVVISCCFHKLHVKGAAGFPYSRFLTERLKTCVGPLITTTFLRLAAESTRERWADKNEESISLHAKAILFRAVLELFLFSEGVVVSKKRRKAAKVRAQQWNDYLTHLLDNTDLTYATSGEHVPREHARQKIQLLFESHQCLIDHIAAFSCLQVCLQGVAEGLIQMDRLAGLMERGFSSAKLFRVANPKLSPRSIALIVKKS